MVRAAVGHGRHTASRARFLLLLAILLAAVGCLGLPQPTPDPKLPDAQQILRPLASGPNAGDIDTFDPAQIQFGFDYDKAQMIYPALITAGRQQAGRLGGGAMRSARMA